jgi:sugar/nucleoside kinase (ribokinase family)
VNAPVSVAVIGDAMVDVVAQRECDASSLEYVEVRTALKVGGSALNLARAARHAGFRAISVICSLSKEDEIATRSVRSELADAGIALIENSVSGQPAGITIVGYLGSAERIMLASPGANEVALGPEVISAAIGSAPDIIVVSGYMLFRQSTRESVQEIMRGGSSAGSLVVLDAVPHSIHATMKPAEFTGLLADVDFLAGASGTFAGFGLTVETLLSLVDAVLAFERDGSYLLAGPECARVRDRFCGPEEFAGAGVSEALIMTVLRDYAGRS